MGAYAGAVALAAVLLVFFKPAGAGDCSFNVSMIVLTLLVGVVLSGVSMSAWVRALFNTASPGCTRPKIILYHMQPSVVFPRRAAHHCLHALSHSILVACAHAHASKLSTAACCPARCITTACVLPIHAYNMHVRMRAQAVNGSLFPSALLTLYTAYLGYSALVSEPHDYPCNGLGQRLNAASTTTLAAGMALALISVVYSALRAGSNTALFRFSSYDYGDAAGPAGKPLLDDDLGRAYVKV